MKYAVITIILSTFAFFSCNQSNEKSESKELEIKPNFTNYKNTITSKKNIQTFRKDTLQYIMEGENEDNIYSVFLTKKLDTIKIVLDNNQHLDSTSKNKMYYAEWRNKLMKCGGDEKIKYQQAFMKKFIEIKVKSFK